MNDRMETARPDTRELLDLAHAAKGCELNKQFERMSFEDTIKTMAAIEKSNVQARKADSSLPVVQFVAYSENQRLVRANLSTQINGWAGPTWRTVLESTVVMANTTERVAGEKFNRCYDYSEHAIKK